MENQEEEKLNLPSTKERMELMKEEIAEGLEKHIVDSDMVKVSRGGRKTTDIEYLDKLNQALDLILYKNLSQYEFRKTYSKEFSVSEVTADVIYRKCKALIKERYTLKNEEMIDMQMARYMDLLDRARIDGNKRVERETLWDISRIMGLEQKKVDVTSNGLPLDIRINLSNAPKD